MKKGNVNPFSPFHNQMQKKKTVYTQKLGRFIDEADQDVLSPYIQKKSDSDQKWLKGTPEVSVKPDARNSISSSISKNRSSFQLQTPKVVPGNKSMMEVSVTPTTKQIQSVLIPDENQQDNNPLFEQDKKRTTHAEVGFQLLNSTKPREECLFSNSQTQFLSMINEEKCEELPHLTTEEVDQKSPVIDRNKVNMGLDLFNSSFHRDDDKHLEQKNDYQSTNDLQNLVNKTAELGLEILQDSFHEQKNNQFHGKTEERKQTFDQTSDSRHNIQIDKGSELNEIILKSRSEKIERNNDVENKSSLLNTSGRYNIFLK